MICKLQGGTWFESGTLKRAWLNFNIMNMKLDVFELKKFFAVWRLAFKLESIKNFVELSSQCSRFKIFSAVWAWITFVNTHLTKHVLAIATHLQIMYHVVTNVARENFSMFNCIILGIFSSVAYRVDCLTFCLFNLIFHFLDQSFRTLITFTILLERLSKKTSSSKW